MTNLETAAAGVLTMERIRRRIVEIVEIEQDLAIDILGDGAIGPVASALADLRAALDQAVNHAAHPLREAAKAGLSPTFDPEVHAGKTTILPAHRVVQPGAPPKPARNGDGQ